jgi:serine/threonine protein kinase
MSDLSHGLDQTELLDSITSRFESAWKEALHGGIPPTVETFLESVSEAEREALRGRLSALEEKYRRLADSAAAQSATLTWQDGQPRSPPTLATPVTGTVGRAAASEDAALATTDGPSSGSPPTTPVSWPHVPGYEIECELGRGGMGVVYRARQTDLQRRVALKMILAGGHASPSQLARFRAEARAEARLQHPNIVQVYEIGEHNGVPYFSLEYVDGGNLGQWAGRQPQPPRDAAHLVETLARATNYAHERGVIHRDLKPANILLSFSREHAASASGGALAACSRLNEALPKIGDFGLAKFVDDESTATRTGTVIGTPSYMAPEQALGRQRDIGPATDVYSLGAILYELLVGRPPFLAATMIDTVEQVRTEEPVAPTRLQPKLPRDLETICLKCLHKDARRRYARALELAEDLRRFLAGEPIQARPARTAERLWRWCQRNPRVAGLTAAVALLLIAITAGALAFAYQIDRKQRETEDARATADRNAEQALAESQRADASAREADARYNMALDALNVVVGRMQTQLEDTPGTEHVRTLLLQAAMDVLRKNVDQGDSSGLGQRAMASAHMVMGNILWAKQDPAARKEAVKEYETCHSILIKLYEANPDSDKAAGNYAMSLGKQGDLDADLRQDFQSARTRYYEALAIQEDLVLHARPKQEVPLVERKASLANSYERLAAIAEQIGPDAQDDPVAMLEKARKLREEVAREDPAHGRRALGHVHYLLGERKWKRHQETEAEKHYDAALTQCVAAVREDPHSLKAKSELFNLCGNAGDNLLLHGDTALARKYYSAALGPSEQLAAIDGRPAVHRILSQNYYRMATACLRLNDRAAAESYYNQCLGVREKLYAIDSKNTGIFIDVMIARARCRQVDRAVALAEDLQRRQPRNPALLYQVACCYALCSDAVVHGKQPAEITTEDRARQEQYARLAVTALRAARASGYKDVRNLEVEPDLDAIRSDSGFDSFMREFRKP